jgi:hypothetical protein
VYLKVKLCKATEIISSSWWRCWMCHAYLLATNLTVLRSCAYQCKQHEKIVSRSCMAHFFYSCNICTVPRYNNKNKTLTTTHSIYRASCKRVESLQCGSHFDHVGLGTQMQMTNVHHASLLLGLPPLPITSRQQQLIFIRSWQPHQVCTTESTD